MQVVLKFGISVVTSDGFDVGSLHHVVLDETTYAVSAIAVRRRLLESGNLLKPGGWSMPRDQRVEIASVTGADEDEIRVTLTEEEFLALPPYVLGAVAEPEAGWTPPADAVADEIASRAEALLGGTPYAPPTDEVENRGPNDRHLSAGAKVWRREPHTHLGEVNRVLLDDTTNTASGLVVTHGALFAHAVMLPIRYVVELYDDLVHVDIPESEWRSLAAYEPEE